MAAKASGAANDMSGGAGIAESERVAAKAAGAANGMSGGTGVACCCSPPGGFVPIARPAVPHILRRQLKARDGALQAALVGSGGTGGGIAERRRQQQRGLLVIVESVCCTDAGLNLEGLEHRGSRRQLL